MEYPVPHILLGWNRITMLFRSFWWQRFSCRHNQMASHIFLPLKLVNSILFTHGIGYYCWKLDEWSGMINRISFLLISNISTLAIHIVFRGTKYYITNMSEPYYGDRQDKGFVPFPNRTGIFITIMRMGGKRRKRFVIWIWFLVGGSGNAYDKVLGRYELGEFQLYIKGK